MFSRFFWFLIGIGFAVFVYTRLRAAWAKARPEALGHRVADSAAGVGVRAQDFVDRVRAGMAERETEIRSSLGLPE